MTIVSLSRKQGPKVLTVYTAALIKQPPRAFLKMKISAETKPDVFNVNEERVPEDVGTLSSKLAHFSNF